VDLVEDQVAHRRKRLPALRVQKEYCEAFRREREDRRRAQQEAPALGLRRVARTRLHADLGELKPGFSEALADRCERLKQIPFYVLVERLQRRDVKRREPVRRVRARAALAPRAEARDRRHERRQRFPAAGRRQREDVLPALDSRPRLGLDRGRRPVGLCEPLTDYGMER